MFLSVTGTKNFTSIFLSKSTSAFRVAIYFLSFTSDKTQSLSKCINEASEGRRVSQKGKGRSGAFGEEISVAPVLRCLSVGPCLESLSQDLGNLSTRSLLGRLTQGRQMGDGLCHKHVQLYSSPALGMHSEPAAV
jgi:hypothetical protein